MLHPVHRHPKVNVQLNEIVLINSHRMSNMSTLLNLFVWLMVTSMLAHHCHANKTDIRVTEHCEAEIFHAECASDEVISMTLARYGRMKVGRCVIRDYGYAGCHADVLPHMDSLCSGRRTCEVRIPDASLDAVKPCPPDFKTYLESSYHCIQVKRPSCESCNNASVIRATGPAGFLSSHSEATLTPGGCERGRCPWLIEASPGQRLNVTLLDFHGNLSADPAENKGSQFSGFSPCHRYALITEPSEGSEVEICGGLGRERHIYSSVGSAVTITPLDGRIRGEVPKYLLKYTVFGCADLDAPPHTWLERNGDELVMGCTGSDKTFHLTCNGQEWKGSIGTCPTEAAVVGKSKQSLKFKLPTGVLVAIIVGIALIIGAVILTIGLVFIKRRRAANAYSSGKMKRDFSYEKAGPSGLCDSASEYSYCAPYTPSSPKPCTYETIINASVGNIYAHTMDLRPLPAVPPCRTCRGNAQANTLSHNSHSYPTASSSSEYTAIDVISDAERARATAYATIDVIKGTEHAQKAGYDPIDVVRSKSERQASPTESSLLVPKEVKCHSRSSSSGNSSSHSYCVPLTSEGGDYSEPRPYFTLDRNNVNSKEVVQDSSSSTSLSRSDDSQTSSNETGNAQNQVPVQVCCDDEDRSPSTGSNEVLKNKDDQLSEEQNALNESLSARNSLRKGSDTSIENVYHQTL